MVTHPCSAAAFALLVLAHAPTAKAQQSGPYRGPSDLVSVAAGGQGLKTWSGEDVPMRPLLMCGTCALGLLRDCSPTRGRIGTGVAVRPEPRMVPDVDQESWAFWWELNKDAFLDVKASVYDDEPLFPGCWVARASAEQGRRRLDTMSVERIVNALAHTAQTDADPELVAASLLALAKIGTDATRTTDEALLSLFGDHLDHADVGVRKTAAVALGVLGHPEGIEPLVEVLRESDDVRPVRAFAGYGLGLLGATVEDPDRDRAIVEALVWALEASERESYPDVGIAAVTALGLTPLPASGKLAVAGEDESPWTSAEAQIAFFLERFRNLQSNRFVHSHVATALGRLLRSMEGAPTFADLKADVAEALLLPLEYRRGRYHSSELRAAAALALGLVGDCDDDPVDREIRKALSDDIHHQQSQTRKFALMALAQCGSRRGDAEEEPWAGRTDVERFLLMRSMGGTAGEDLWAAIALGVHAHRLREGGEAPTEEVLRALSTRLERARVADHISAFSIAAGIAADSAAVERLRFLFGKVTLSELRGDVGLALGMLGSEEDLHRLLDELERAPQEHLLATRTATAAARLGSLELVPLLDRLRSEATDPVVRDRLTVQLGRLGDIRAVAPLLGVLEDAARAPRERTAAAVALGCLADKGRLPWNARIANDMPFHASTLTMCSYSEGGVLNLW